MADDAPDMEKRDPNDLNAHIKVKFEEVLGEPDSVRSIDCVWRNGYKCFTCAFNCCYKTLTAICGLPIALCWGCEFACLACYHIWYYTPALSCMRIHLVNFRKCYSMCLDSYLGPCCETFGLCLSKIAVKQTN